MKKRLLIILSSIAIFCSGVFIAEYIKDSYALNLSRVKTWSAEVLTHTDLNAEFDSILAHEITNADISATAAIAASKINFTVASAIGSTTPSTGAFTTLSTTGAVTAGGTIASDTDNTDDLGSSSYEWKDLYIDGIAYIDAISGGGDWDMGAYEFRAQTLEADVTTGTAPFTITSTTKSTNLNADLLDGSHASTTTGSAVIPIADASGYLPNDSIDTTALKTATGAVSQGGTSTWGLHTLPGGEYGFYPQIKNSTAGISTQATFKTDGGTLTTNYLTIIHLRSGSYTIYAQQRYVTASGTDQFIFIKIDKGTKDIISCYQAPDHPSYGQGGNYEKLPHPFGNYDKTKYEIILLDQATCKQLKQESEATIQEEGEQPERCILTILNEDYKVNLTKKEPYIPLHSGKYKKTLKNGKEVVTKHMIQTIPNYISVRKLIRLTEQEKETREMLREAHRIANEQKKEEKKQDRITGVNKLKALGLSKEEVVALVGE